MKIPVDALKKHLHNIMYRDTATVYRSVKVVEEETGAVDYEFQPVIENLPCKLSQYKEIYADQDDRTQNVTLDFRLTCDPEIVIEEDDIVDILHEGELFKLVAGTSFNYITHKEISMRRRREAMQT